ncbi:MAG: hypothetical protein M1831_005724 [Alyxoria varia]|nr:MAG: hypothetical protein M1831_005724 [Alyxoria varia]
MNGSIGNESPPWHVWYIGKTSDGAEMYAVDTGYWNFICKTENEIQWCDEEERDPAADTPYDWGRVPENPDKNAIDTIFKAEQPAGMVRPKDGSEIYLDFIE